MNKHIICCLWGITFFIYFIAMSNAIAQPPPIGAIAGFVANADNSIPLEGVLVRAMQSDTGIEVFRDSTGSDGLYIMPEMQLGLYDLEASKYGFVTQTQAGIEIFMDQITSVDFGLHRVCSYVEGDVNNNGLMNGIDVTYGVSYFKGGPPPPYSCYCDGRIWYVAGDVNGDCVFNGMDVVYVIACFKSGFPYHGCSACRGTK